MRLRMLGFVLLFVAGVGAVAGCGGTSTVEVDGKVMNGANPYSPEKDGDLTIGLVSDDGKTNKTQKVNEDGTFKIEGVPTGKYTITANHYPSKAVMEKAKGEAPTADMRKSDEPVEITSSNKSITVDFAKMKK